LAKSLRVIKPIEQAKLSLRTQRKNLKKFPKPNQTAVSIAYEHFSPKKIQAKKLPAICNATLRTTSGRKSRPKEIQRYIYITGKYILEKNHKK